jgi:hypothetical protein
MIPKETNILNIKNILIISHGNADVERGFSINGNILTEERTLLSEKSI